MIHGVVHDDKPPRYCDGDVDRPHPRTQRVKQQRGSVVVDQCPVCRTILLDDGELERIVATLSSTPGYNPPQHLVYGSPQYQAPPPYQTHGGYHGDSSDRRRGGHHGHRRESFLEELFD